jgi:hypothetical protein
MLYIFTINKIQKENYNKRQKTYSNIKIKKKNKKIKRRVLT